MWGCLRAVGVWQDQLGPAREGGLLRGVLLYHSVWKVQGFFFCFLFFFPSLLSFELEEARVVLILFLYLKPNLDPAVPSWSPPRNPIPITSTFPGYVFLSAVPFGFVFFQCPDLAVLPSLPDSLHVRIESSCALKKVSLNRSQLSFVPLSCGATGSPAVVLLTTESLLF